MKHNQFQYLRQCREEAPREEDDDDEDGDGEHGGELGAAAHGNLHAAPRHRGPRGQTPEERAEDVGDALNLEGNGTQRLGEKCSLRILRRKRRNVLEALICVTRSLLNQTKLI